MFDIILADNPGHYISNVHVERKPVADKDGNTTHIEYVLTVTVTKPHPDF